MVKEIEENDKNVAERPVKKESLVEEEEDFDDAEELGEEDFDEIEED
jgi:hypothetical protein